MFFRHGHCAEPPLSQTEFQNSEPITQLDPVRADAELWWMGPMIYYLQADNLWLPAVCRISGCWVDHQYMASWLSAGATAPVVIDAGAAIRREIQTLGLTPNITFNGWSFDAITPHQVSELVALAERWRLGWSVSRTPMRRILQKPLILHGFTFTYGRT